MTEKRADTLIEIRGDDVLEAARLQVGFGVLDGEGVGEQTLGQAMTPHHIAYGRRLRQELPRSPHCCYGNPPPFLFPLNSISRESAMRASKRVAGSLQRSKLACRTLRAESSACAASFLAAIQICSSK
jgi:hypothetical protein